MNTNILIVGVVGTGTMGAGIAQTFAQSGYQVICYDICNSAIERGMNLIHLNQDNLIKAGFLTKESAQLALSRLKTTLNIEDLGEVDFICEAVTEDIKVKHEVFSSLDKICRKDIIFSSNTSGLSITKMASVVSNRERFAGMHWWNPPHVMPLIEVIKGDESSEETCLAIMDICRKLGKKPVYVKKDILGFVGNRLQIALQREAMYIMEMGAANQEDIDEVIKYGPGARWALYGPCQLLDLGGLDVFGSIFSYLAKDLNNDPGVPKIIAEKVAKGELGIKTGKGLFQYTKEKIEKLIGSRDRRLLKIIKLQDEE